MSAAVQIGFECLLLHFFGDNRFVEDLVLVMTLRNKRCKNVRLMGFLVYHRYPLDYRGYMVEVPIRA